MVTVGYLLKMKGYLEEKVLSGTFAMTVIKLSSKGQRWLDKAKFNATPPPLTLTPSSPMLAYERPPPQQPR